MNSLLDTNVVSEWVKPRPDPGVITWLAEVDEDRVFLSVVTLAELRYSIERMPVGARRNRLNLWLREELPLRFTGRILPVTPAVAEAWGYVAARSQAGGRTMSIMDTFLAATVEVHGLTMVTRNVADFSVLGHSVLNPWTA
jgi:predicted nucleic acid-binding protein